MGDNSLCTLVLVRHAASRGSATFIGQNDEPLSAAGGKQLTHLVEKLSRFRFEAVYASDLARTMQTAKEVARRLSLELKIRPALREMHFGRWQGLSWKQITEHEPRLAGRWLKNFPMQSIPGAERFTQFKRRVKQEFQTIVRANQGRCVLVVTHAGVIRVALADALGIRDKNIFRLAADPCAMNVVEYSAEGVMVRCVNA
jgi:broad specificity phosphatase PhoE